MKRIKEIKRINEIENFYYEYKNDLDLRNVLAEQKIELENIKTELKLNSDLELLIKLNKLLLFITKWLRSVEAEIYRTDNKPIIKINDVIKYKEKDFSVVAINDEMLEYGYDYFRKANDNFYLLYCDKYGIHKVISEKQMIEV